MAAAPPSRSSLVARSASGTGYERMRTEALDLEAGSAASTSNGGTSPRARRPRIPPPARWWPALRALLHHEPKQLTHEELEAHMDDYCELLAMLDLYLEWVPDPLAALRARDRAADASVADKLARAAASATPRGSALADADADALADRLHTMQLEDVLVGMAKALHNAGCPVWRMEFNLTTVARGLGLPGTQFAVFPSFILVTFSRLLSDGHGGKTLYIPTSPGLNMHKLDAVDSLARRIAAYGTNTPTPFRDKPAGAYPASLAAAAAAAAGPCGRDMRRRVTDLRARFADGAGAGAAALGRAALELASGGPGFFMYSKHMGNAPFFGADEEEDDWAPPDGTVRGGTLHASTHTSTDGAQGPAASAVSLARTASNGASDAPSSSSPSAAAPAEASPGRGRATSPRPRSRYQRRRDAFIALALEDALACLLEIESAKPLYPAWAQAAAMGIAAFGCAITFFGGGWWDAALAGLLGCMVGAMGTYASASGVRFIRAYEFLASAAIAFISRVADSAVRPVCMQPVVLSALIWLLQGWTMTNAVVELATRNPISGTSHLFVGVVTTAMMGFGLDAGSALADAFGIPPTSAQGVDVPHGACSHAVSPWFYLPLFVPTSLSFSLLLNADRSQLVPMTALACVAFFCSYLFSLAQRTAELASFLAAVVVGAGGNAYANTTGRPAMASTCSGIFILVPGAMALRSIAQVFNAGGNGSDGSSSGGLALTSRVLTVAVSIGAGIFMSSLLLPPREVVHVRGKAARAAASTVVAGGASLAAHGGYTRMLNLAPVNM